jgi:hypothetical protein
MTGGYPGRHRAEPVLPWDRLLRAARWTAVRVLVVGGPALAVALHELSRHHH